MLNFLKCLKNIFIHYVTLNNKNKKLKGSDGENPWFSCRSLQESLRLFASEEQGQLAGSRSRGCGRLYQVLRRDAVDFFTFVVQSKIATILADFHKHALWILQIFFSVFPSYRYISNEWCGYNLLDIYYYSLAPHTVFNILGK